jgi:hypothetical protein
MADDGDIADAEAADMDAGGESDDTGPAEPGGVTGLGAETPAISEPRPSFCRLNASSLPFESRPFEDWNFCRAATVFESHLPVRSPP